MECFFDSHTECGLFFKGFLLPSTLAAVRAFHISRAIDVHCKDHRPKVWRIGVPAVGALIEAGFLLYAQAKRHADKEQYPCAHAHDYARPERHSDKPRDEYSRKQQNDGEHAKHDFNAEQTLVRLLFELCHRDERRFKLGVDKVLWHNFAHKQVVDRDAEDFAQLNHVIRIRQAVAVLPFGDCAVAHVQFFCQLALGESAFFSSFLQKFSDFDLVHICLLEQNIAENALVVHEPVVEFAPFQKNPEFFEIYLTIFLIFFLTLYRVLSTFFFSISSFCEIS